MLSEVFTQISAKKTELNKIPSSCYGWLCLKPLLGQYKIKTNCIYGSMKYHFRYTIGCMIMDLESGGIIPIQNKQNKYLFFYFQNKTL